MKFPNINLKSKITLISFFLFIIIFSTILFIINGYIWVIFAFFLWLILLSLIFFILAKFVSKKKKKSRSKVFTTILILLFLSVYSYPCFLMPISHFRSEGNKEELKIIVNELIKDTNSDEEKTKAILEWFNITDNNIFNNYHLGRKGVFSLLIWPRGQFRLYLCEPYFGIRTFNDDDSLWILTSRYGHCGEYGLIFRDLADAAGLQVRKITCSGEDHVWNEVLIDDNWVVIDATRVGSASDSGYNVSPRFIEQKVAGNRGTLNGSVSYVEAEYLNGTKVDVTETYTNIVTFNILVIDESNTAIPNAKIFIKSNNRYDLIDTKKTGLITNNSGLCSFYIGGGNYKFEVITDEYIPLYGELTGEYLENNSFYNLTIYVKSDWTKGFSFLIHLILIIIVLTTLVGLFFYTYINERKKM